MKDNLLFVNARGFQVLYNACMIALLWVTRGWRAGQRRAANANRSALTL